MLNVRCPCILTTANPSVYRSKTSKGLKKVKVTSCCRQVKWVPDEQTACTAYSRYILDVGQSEDWLALQVALAPCLIGYGVIARRLHEDKRSIREGNRYWQWIENYVAEDYVEAVEMGSGRIS